MARQIAYLLVLMLLTGCKGINASKPYGTVIVVASPTNGGQVSGGGSYPAQSTVQISAAPFTGWMFNQWNDGNQNATRLVSVPNPNGTVTYTGFFTQTGPAPAQITLGWTAEPTAVSYRVYNGPSSGHYTNWTAETGTTFMLTVPSQSVNYFAVTSVNAAGIESTNYSNEISYTAP